MAARSSSTLGPWFCTVSVETPARRPISGNVVPAYPRSANSSAAARTTRSRVSAAC